MENFENVSENAHEMLDSEDIEPNSLISHMLPSESLSGECSPVPSVEIKFATHAPGENLQYQTTEEENLPSLTPRMSHVRDVDISSLFSLT